MASSIGETAEDLVFTYFLFSLQHIIIVYTYSLVLDMLRMSSFAVPAVSEMDLPT